MRWLRFALLSALLLAATARARTATEIRQIVVLPITVTSGVAAEQAPLLDDMLLTELSRRTPPSIRIIGSRDVANLLGHEEQKQLLGCSDSSCLIEIGNALGASHILSASAGRIGERTVVSGTLLDVVAAAAVHRETLYRGAGEDELVEALRELSDKLVASPGWQAGTAWAQPADPSSAALLWPGVAMLGGGALLAVGLGGGALYFNSRVAEGQGTRPVEELRSDGALSLGLAAASALGGAVLIGGAVLTALALAE